MRMRATSRSIAGILLRWYAVWIIRSTMPAMSGRSDHTIAASPPGPSGMSMRATNPSLRPCHKDVRSTSHLCDTELGDDLGVVVLAADLLDVFVPRAVVRVG